MTTGAIILAAGQSRRFGEQNKLLATVNGAPMTTHVMRLVLRADIASSVVVASSPDVFACASMLGLSVCSITPDGPQSASLRAGLVYLKNEKLSRVLILLGDMPFVTSEDISELLASPHDIPACTAMNETLMPPAIIPRRLFDALDFLTGDRGAGSLLRQQRDLRRIVLPAAHLRDIDFQEDLFR
ncbi:nucleotidyltransferase family protein [Brucella sp. 10RB9213]|uniref:nucleotidyltransferase family protein n=1 Tax=Brucella sp. 10RB9213 TaxID=1844039 RepID=UPI0012AE60F0|nr:nucleotidyltransferase family protein [Brucella sp. 10RB9213]MRN67546.1 NTP transferase domain-containing protein [Brucella sp. 10RB9213]